MTVNVRLCFTSKSVYRHHLHTEFSTPRRFPFYERESRKGYQRKWLEKWMKEDKGGERCNATQVLHDATQVLHDFTQVLHDGSQVLNDATQIIYEYYMMLHDFTQVLHELCMMLHKCCTTST